MSPRIEWLTVAEAAAILRVDRRTVYRAVRDRRIPHQRIRSLIRIPASAVTPRSAQ